MKSEKATPADISAESPPANGNPVKSWGGRRSGSGRKKTNCAKVQVSAVVSQSVADYLAGQDNQSQAIESAILSYPDYRDWVVLARVRRMREKLDAGG